MTQRNEVISDAKPSVLNVRPVLGDPNCPTRKLTYPMVLILKLLSKKYGVISKRVTIF